MPLDAVVRTQVEAWLRKADNDLRNIELVLPAENAPLDTVVFHAQQAGEKALKALLTARGTPSRGFTTSKNWQPGFLPISELNSEFSMMTWLCCLSLA